jgi:hypothetical protein
MTKFVINTCYGGFGLSRTAKLMYEKLTGQEPYSYSDNEIPRDDPTLIAVIETLGNRNAGTGSSDLKIFDIPAGTRYRIEEYDGNETIMYESQYDWFTA